MSMSTREATRVWIYGDNIDTDVIIPARYLVTTDPAELAKHCMEDIDATFANTVQPGDVIVGGANFGCGSSREHAPLAIKGSGVAVVIASSFARIFFRNAINIGLPILECPEAVAGIHAGDSVTVDLASGTITNATSGLTFQAQPYPESILNIIAAGGLIAATREKLRKAGKLPVEATSGDTK
jgi:3-isopropylmalate/(R)-2-methylmalate dehydratase small subunit